MAINRSCGLLWSSMGILLLLCSAKADKVVPPLDQKDSPVSNVNLSPFQQWRSAYDCMQKYQGKCSQTHKLSITGMLSVSKDEILDYCNPDGCKGNIDIVLTCIHYVKRDFHFGNGYTVPELTDHISNACGNKTALSTPLKASSATRMFKGLPITLMSALPTVLLMIIFNI